MRHPFYGIALLAAFLLSALPAFGQAGPQGIFFPGNSGGQNGHFNSLTVGPGTIAITGGSRSATANSSMTGVCVNGVCPATAFGFIGDGASHPLSTYYSSLAAAQTVYPWVQSLTDEMDGVAVQACLYAAAGGYTRAWTYTTNNPYQYGGTCQVPPREWRFNKTILLPTNTALVGLGSSINGLAVFPPYGSLTNIQHSVGLWTHAAANDNQAVAAIRTLNQIQKSIPAYSGTAVSATGGAPGNVVFNASGVPSIASGTFVGAVITDTTLNQTRTCATSSSYSAPNYTCVIGNPWTAPIPSAGDALSIAAAAQGSPYLGIDGLAGNCMNYTFAYTNGVQVQNIGIMTDNETPVGFLMQCAGAGVKLYNTQAVGFNVGRFWDETYYFDDELGFDVSRQEGVILDGAANGIMTSYQAWPLVTTSGATDIYRPTATDRPSTVGNQIAVGNDPGYYLNTGIYDTAVYPVVFNGGDIGETCDRGAFVSGSGTLTFHGSVFERQGAYPTSGGPITGAVGVWTSGGQPVILDAVQWLRGAGTSSAAVSLVGGCTPNYRLSSVTTNDPTNTAGALTFGFTTAANVCGPNGTFNYGGNVWADATTLPTAADTTPFNTNALGSTTQPAIFHWDYYGGTTFLNVGANQTINSCDGPVAVNAFSGAYTVTLPQHPPNGTTCVIFDSGNHAATNNITINSQTGFFGNGPGAGSATMKITTNSGGVRLLSVGVSGGWEVVP